MKKHKLLLTSFLVSSAIATPIVFINISNKNKNKKEFQNQKFSHSEKKRLKIS